MLVFVSESLSKRGYNVSIANLNSTTEYASVYRRPVLDSVCVHESSKGSCASIKGKIKFVLDIAKRQKCDIIIGFTSTPSLIARIVGAVLGIPSIMSERGDPSVYTLKSMKTKLFRSIINSSRGGVFQTEGARDFYGRGLRKRAVVIPNPIFIKGDIPCVKQCEREKSVVSVGRLDNEQKRYDIMLDAFKLFSDLHPEYILKLYGKGDDEALITAWVEERGLSDKVKFMGLTTQPMQDIVRDGMFLITSDYEGISNSLLEAMACGLPCVSTDHTPGGARLLIQDHKNGLLAPIADAPALAKAMCEFADNPELAEKCGENAKDVVNRFAPEKIIDMWEDYISKLIKKY